MRSSAALCGVCLLLAGSIAARAQFEEATGPGPKLGEKQTQRWQFGVTIKAVGGPCRGIVGTMPVATDWPEQKVKIVDEDISSNVRKVDYQIVSGTVKQMRIEVPSLADGDEARALITFEITRAALLPPEKTDHLKRPDKNDKESRPYLLPSPFIESKLPKITTLAKEILEKQPEANDWQRVELIYDWVRDNIQGSKEPIPIKGALAALRDKKGDCEDLSSLFIALCRASDIPARTVWIPGHCYPEFYLVDEAGKGAWYPCEPHGGRSFGGIPEHRPVLQKGDNFRNPDDPKKPQRYLAEHLKGAAVQGGGKPQVKFIRRAVAASDEPK